MKKLFLIATLLFSTSAVAEENKVLNWLKTEWVKTVEFQKESWEEGKEQVSNNKLQIQDLWNKVKDNVTQD